MFQKVRDMLLLCNDKCVHDQAFEKYVQHTQAMDSDYECMYEEFNVFLERLCGLDDNWNFWNNFVFHDMLAYVGLYLGICGGLWDLRMASLKEMRPVFTAFDRLNYLKILPNHFAEVLNMPERISTGKNSQITLMVIIMGILNSHCLMGMWSNNQ